MNNDRFDTDDGAQYQRVDPSEFDCFDEVDSTTIDSTTDDHRRRVSLVRSQNSWPANDRSVIATYTIPGTTRQITMRKGDVSVVLLDLAAWIHRTVEALDSGELDDWGYAERNVRGSSTVVSNHASGTAIDLNALRHPRGKRGTWGKAAAKIRLKVATYDGVIRWGEDYSPPTPCDGMHAEINKGPDAVRKVADRIRAAGAPTGKYPTIQRGDTGDAVKLIQRFLGVVKPGDPGYGNFADQTYAAVRRYQAMRGLVVDGVVGPATWAATGL